MLTSMEGVTGGAGRDVLSGDPGANALTRGAGNDRLIASAGGEALDGGTGADTAGYSQRPPGVSATASTAARAATARDGRDVLRSIAVRL